MISPEIGTYNSKPEVSPEVLGPDEDEVHRNEIAFANALKDLVNGDLAKKIPRESVIEWLESLAFAMRSHNKEG